METNPFTLLGRLIVASFEIAFLLATFVVEAGWYVAHGRRDKVGDAIGEAGRGISKALFRAFRK